MSLPIRYRTGAREDLDAIVEKYLREDPDKADKFIAGYKRLPLYLRQTVF